MTSSSRGWLTWLLLGGLILLAAGVFLPLNPIADGDPAFYGMIARNILTSGDWLTLHHRLMPLVDKPPLTFWIMALSFGAFGTAEWVLHVWHTLCALAVLATTYALGRLALPRHQAALAVLVLLVSLEFFYESLIPRQDIPLTLFIAQAVYWHLRWERGHRSSSALLSWLAAALAVLTKGIIGLALPVLVAGLHVLVHRPDLPRRAFLHVAAGIGVFALAVAPWFAAGIMRLGKPFVDAFLLGGALGVGRFFHPVLASPTAVPWWAGFGAYVPLALFGALPWTGWVWPALREAWVSRRSGTRDGAMILQVCLLWVAAVFGFHSLSLGDKTMRYLLPMFPPLAVLLACVVGDDRFTRSAVRTSIGAAAVLLATAIALLVVRLPTATEPYLSYASYATYAPLFTGFLVTLGAALAGFAALALWRRPRAGLAWLTLGTLAAHALVIVWLALRWDQISPWRPLARVVNRVPAPGARVLIVGEHTDFADFYIDRPVEFVERDALVRAWTRGPVLAIAPAPVLAALPPPRPNFIATRQGLAVVSNGPTPQLPKR
jgi:4-amino-4-deoxy-L-arabinose transferase-like glycosyltransferase